VFREVRKFSVLLVIISIYCYGPQRILYQYSVPADTQEDRRIHFFSESTALQMQEVRNGNEIRLTALPRYSYRRIAHRLRPLGESQTGRIPDVMLFRLDVFRVADTPVRVDYYKFFIKDTGSGKIFSAVSALEYESTYRSAGSILFDFFWGFEQKDSFRFLHPLPDYFIRASEPDTASRQEIIEREKAQETLLAFRHEVSTLLAPRRQLKGYLVFPIIPAGHTYSLEYAAGSEFTFLPFVFELKSVRADPSPPDIPESEDLEELLDREQRLDEAELRELYVMHRQREIHTEVKETGEARSYTPRGGFQRMP